MYPKSISCIGSIGSSIDIQIHFFVEVLEFGK